MNDFVAFNANGSGWVLDRVSEICLHMVHYSTGNATTTTTSSTDYDKDEPIVYSTEYDTANKKSDDDDLLDENGYFPTPDFFKIRIFYIFIEIKYEIKIHYSFIDFYCKLKGCMTIYPTEVPEHIFIFLLV